MTAFFAFLTPGELYRVRFGIGPGDPDWDTWLTSFGDWWVQGEFTARFLRELPSPQGNHPRTIWDNGITLDGTRLQIEPV